MPEKKDILKELKEISPAVANLPDSNCLSNPPAGYFSSLPDMIMSNISDAEAAQSINPFNSPVTLSTELFPEEEQNPVWEKISKEFPLEAPVEQFFEKFKDQVLSRIAEEKEALLLQSESDTETPVISFYKRKSGRYFTQWAAAAAVVILVGISSLMYFQNQSTPGNPINLSAELPNIGDQELNAFIGDQPQEVMPDATIATVNSDDFENLFSDVDDEEMKNYLKQDRLSNILNLN